ELPGRLQLERPGQVEQVEDGEEVSVPVTPLQSDGVDGGGPVSEEVRTSDGDRRCCLRGHGRLEGRGAHHCSGTAALLPAPSSTTTWASAVFSTSTEKLNSGPGVNASGTPPILTDVTPMLSRATPSTLSRLPAAASTEVSSTVGGVASSINV